MFGFSTLPVIETEIHARMPEALRRRGETPDWVRANLGGRPTDSFIEGPCRDPQGNLYLVDIPYGRLLAVDPGGAWRVVAQYDGEPNGLAWHPDGYLLVADYRHGLMAYAPGAAAPRPLLERRNSERFKGPNDLIVAPGGDIYFTDQGQTGLHDPTGRVYRLRPDGRLDCLIANGPSPNGLALNGSGDVLYVSMTRDNSVWRLPLLPDGSASKVGRLFQFWGVGGPDGMAMDERGNLLVAHASLGVVVAFDPWGEPKAVVRSCAGRAVTNVCIGEDGWLYITESATASVLKADWAAARDRFLPAYMPKD